MDVQSNQTSSFRSHRLIGPTLGKGKACESCRTRRIRCNGAHPTCFNCVQFSRECVYVSRARPPSSANALASKVAELEERYQILTGNVPGGDGSRQSTHRLVSHLLDPETSLRLKADALGDPWLVKTMGKTARNLMLEVYMRECYRYVATIAPPTFFEQLELEDERQRPHPCLVNAMILVALDIAAIFPLEASSAATGVRSYDFQIPEATPSPENLVAATQAHSAQSLANADRLQDYIQAQLLLGFWYLRNGRLAEAHYLFAATNRLIISSRLHQMDGEVFKEIALHRNTGQSLEGGIWEGSLLGPPRNVEDLALRVSIFWQSFFGDKASSLMTGLPPTYDSSVGARITTPWPRDYMEYLTGAAFDIPHTSYGDLFSTNPQHVQDTSFGMLFKGMAILDKSVQFASLNGQCFRFLADPLVWTRDSAPTDKVTLGDLARLDAVIFNLKTDFLGICNGTVLGGHKPPTRSQSFRETSFKSIMQLFIISSSIYSTYVRPIDGPVPDESQQAKKRLELAHLCTDVVRTTSDEMDIYGTKIDTRRGKPGVEHLCVTTGHLLSAALNVLVDHVQVLEDRWNDNTQSGARRAQLKREINSEEASLDMLVEVIERVREAYKVVAGSSIDYTW